MRNTSTEREGPGDLKEALTRRHSCVEREQAIIPVVQEELAVRTRRVETGSGVRVEKTVDEREERVDEFLKKEEVEVERVPVNRAVDGPVAVRYEGDTTIVPVLEEVIVVEKRLVLKEEIRITRRQREIHAQQRVVLRREHATVERIENPPFLAAPPDVDPRESVEDPTESLADATRQQSQEVLGKLR